jgi:translation initiation factor 1
MSGLFAGTPLERPLTCERCQKPYATCACPRGRDGKVLDPKDQQVRVRREKRGGKMVTVAAGFSARSERTDDLPGLLAQLKKKFATGGSVDSAGGCIELQGDHREKVVAHLEALGYPAKSAGG